MIGDVISQLPMCERCVYRNECGLRGDDTGDSEKVECVAEGLLLLFCLWLPWWPLETSLCNV